MLFIHHSNVIILLNYFATLVGSLTTPSNRHQVDNEVSLSEGSQGYNLSSNMLGISFMKSLNKVVSDCDLVLPRRMIENYLSSKCYSLLHLRVYFHTYFYNIVKKVTNT